MKLASSFPTRQLAYGLRRIYPTVKILAMSGLAQEDEEDGESVNFEEYAAGFLRKPFKPDTLLSTVQELIQPKPGLGSELGRSG
jgi:hypothetical protein